VDRGELRIETEGERHESASVAAAETIGAGLCLSTYSEESEEP
jgi:hypothetical protein